MATLLALLLSGCAGQPQQTTDTLAEMKKVDNFQGMIAYYKKALKKQPDDPATLQQLADVYYQAGDLESAAFYVEYLQQLAGRSHHTEADQALYYLAGKIYDDQGKYQAALDAFAQSAQRGNQSAELHIRQGIVYSKLGQYQQAEAAFNAARLQGYDDIAIKNNLAVLSLAQGKYQAVVDLLFPIYQQAPDNQTLKVNLALALIKVGNEKQAYEALKDLYTDAQLKVLFRQLETVAQVET